MNAYASFVRKTPPDVEVAAGLNFNPTETKRANNCAPTAGIFSLDTLVQRKFSVTNVVNAATLDLLATAFGEDHPARAKQ